MLFRLTKHPQAPVKRKSDELAEPTAPARPEKGKSSKQGPSTPLAPKATSNAEQTPKSSLPYVIVYSVLFFNAMYLKTRAEAAAKSSPS